MFSMGTVLLFSRGTFSLKNGRHDDTDFFRHPPDIKSIKIPFFESQDPSPQLDMQCHHYALSDFDGGEEKVKQAFLHAGELVARQTTAFGHQFKFETTWSTYRVYFQILSYLV